MKIIHCLNHFLPGQVAGTEIYTNSLVKELLQMQIEAIVLIPNFGKNITESYYHENIRVVKFAEPSIVDRALITGRTVPEGLQHFINVIKEENPSIIHFHIVGGSNGISMHHVYAVKQLSFKIVMTFHLAGYSCKTGNLFYKNEVPCDGIIDAARCTRCIYVDKKMGEIKRNMLYSAAVTSYWLHFDTTRFNTTIGTAIGYPFLVDRMKKDLLALSDACNKMIVLSNWYQMMLEDNGIPPHKLIYIAQGLPKQQPFEKELLKAGVFKLVFVGRIHESKGLHLLIAAIKQLPGHKLKLDIFGQANEDAYAIECKASTEMMSNISWKGQLIPGQIVKTLSNYHCLCIPSVICEMSPLVIQEAFAAGIPVLASDIYGNAEQIKNGENGWLFHFNNSNDLKMKLEELIDNPQKVVLAKQHIPVVKSFGEVAAEHAVLYKEILKQA